MRKIAAHTTDLLAFQDWEMVFLAVLRLPTHQRT